MSKQPSNGPSQRKFERLTFFSEMTLYSGNHSWNCKIVDISLKGILFKKPDDWLGKIKGIYRLSIALEGFPRISMNIEIVNMFDDEIGAKWNKIDLDSFIRLKRVLELNSLNKRRISKEISYL